MLNKTVQACGIKVKLKGYRKKNHTYITANCKELSSLQLIKISLENEGFAVTIKPAPTIHNGKSPFWLLNAQLIIGFV